VLFPICWQRYARPRPGGRDRYAPLSTRLCPDGDPVALATRFCSEYGADTLYLADLDAISGRGDNLGALREIAREGPRLALWVDAGLSDRPGLIDFAERWPGRPVIGSETLSETGTLTVPEGREAVLSLDYRDACLLGPPDLEQRAQDWPRDLIPMSLDRVGAGSGPDLKLLARLRALAPHCRFYAAGGVRHPGDLERLQVAGAAGVLLASALHLGRISASDLARQGCTRFKSPPPVGVGRVCP
jgi:phosphoribosylformimino-5-aminoimidazole carboxamide ribotide isomerase